MTVKELILKLLEHGLNKEVVFEIVPDKEHTITGVCNKTVYDRNQIVNEMVVLSEGDL